MNRILALIGPIVWVAVLGCATGIDPMEQTLRIDAELIEGTSTKADVLRLLGEPTGTGGAVLPPDFELQEVWYYFETETTNTRSEGTVVKADANLRMIGIFFRADRYDGHWFTGSRVEGGEFDLRDLGLPGSRSP